MPTTSTPLLDRVSLTADSTMDPGSAADMADGQTLEIVVTVDEAATGEAPVRVSLSRATRTWIHVPRYTRYVGWSVSGTLDTPAIVSVALLAKG